MSEQSARKLIEARFDSRWANTLPVRWPNSIFKVPRNGAPYVRFNIVAAPNNAFEADMGSDNRRFRHTGTVRIVLKMPRDEGTYDAVAHADTIAAYYRGKSDVDGTTKVVYRAPSIRDAGVDANGERRDTVIEIPFYRDDVFAIT